MVLKQANLDQLNEILTIYTECVQHLQSQGIDQWGSFYPTEDIIRKDIKQGNFYLYFNSNQLIGVSALNENQPEAYHSLTWSVQEGKILVVQRLAVALAFQKQGYGRKFMEKIEQYAITHKFVSIRLDAYTGNPAAIRLYESLGYTPIGQVYFPHRSLPFTCYERAL